MDDPGTPDLGARLAALDTSVLSDALDRLGLPSGLGGFLRWGPAGRRAGRAITVELAEGAAAPGGAHLGASAIDRAGPGHVIVVANGGRTRAGAWGGLLALSADARSVAAVVVDGATRDVEEMAAGDVPVLARATTPRTARGRYHEVRTDGPVEIDGVPVRPGDWVVADETGVVVIPAADTERVLAEAVRLRSREIELAGAIRDGASAAAVLDGSYEAMLDDGPPGEET